MCWLCETEPCATVSNTRPQEEEVDYTLQPFYLVKASPLRQVYQLSTVLQTKRWTCSKEYLHIQNQIHLFFGSFNESRFDLIPLPLSQQLFLILVVTAQFELVINTFAVMDTNVASGRDVVVHFFDRQRHVTQRRCQSLVSARNV